MSRPLADPATIAQLDQYHAELAETLDDLEAATARLVDVHGEYRGLAAMVAFLTDKYGEVPALTAMLAVAMYRRTQHPPAGR